MNDVLFLLLGFVQGVLEWLPISSEGFLFVIATSFGGNPELAFQISLMFHLPTGAAALVYFYRKYVRELKNWLAKKDSVIVSLLIYSSLGTLLTGLPLYVLYKLFLEELEKTIEFFSIVAIAFVGLAMVILGFISKRILLLKGSKNLLDGAYKDFFLVGLLQGLAIIPGVSRSGITIIGFLLLNYDKENAVEASFLMLPIVSFGVFFLELLFGDRLTNVTLGSSILFFILVTFLVSLIVIKFFLDIVKRLSFWKFLVFFGLLIISLSFIYILYVY